MLSQSEPPVKIEATSTSTAGATDSMVARGRAV